MLKKSLPTIERKKLWIKRRRKLNKKLKMLTYSQSIQKCNKSKNLKSQIFMMIWIMNLQNQWNSKYKNQSKRDQTNLKKILNSQKWERISKLNKLK